MPFLPILALIFITLKLTNYITWSWWLVLLPLYPAIIVWSIVAAIAVLSLVENR